MGRYFYIEHSSLFKLYWICIRDGLEKPFAEMVPLGQLGDFFRKYGIGE